MKQTLASHNEKSAAPPEVVPDRCVHSLSHQATCTACIDACPGGAWLLDDDGLNLNVAACDGCGLCVPACPQEAIKVEIKPAKRRLANRTVGFAACDRVPGSEGEGKIPCLHALGVRALARLYRQGIEHLIVARGDCLACPRGEATGIERSVQFMNLHLIDRGLAPIELNELDGASWTRALAMSREARVNGFSRRRLFLRAAETVAEVGENEGVAPTPPTLGCLIAEGGRPDAITPCSPVIAPDRCEGCDACVRLCPNGVFAIDESAEDGGCGYEIEPARCTGCGLCVDVCEADAITLERWSRSPQRRLRLEESACRACGVRFHLPQGRLPADGLCPICSRTHHHQKMFQVMD